MRATPIRRKVRRPSVLVTSREARWALVLLVGVLNVAALAFYPAAASLVLLVSTAVIAIVVMRYPGAVGVLKKAAVLSACVIVLALMLVYVPSEMESVDTSSRTEGLPVVVGYFASATIAMGVTFLAFLTREPRAIAIYWKLTMVILLVVIDIYCWTSYDRIEFLEPLAYGAIWPLTLFTVTIPFSVFAYPKNHISIPSDAWQ